MSDGALRQGWRVTRANPVLVAWSFAGAVLVAATTLAGAVAPLVVALGRDFRRDLEPLLASRSVEAGAEAMVDLEAAFDPSAVTLGVALALALWTVALLIYCYAQAGLWGGLGELRRSPSNDERGAAILPPARLPFWGRRLFARFFWFVNLYAVAASLVLLLAVGVLALGIRGSLVLQLGAALVLFASFLALLVVQLWYGPGRAALAQPGGSLRERLRDGVRLLRQRFALVVMLAALVTVAGVLVSALTSVASSLTSSLFGRLAPVGQLLLALLQGLVVALLGTFHGASLVALQGPPSEASP